MRCGRSGVTGAQTRAVYANGVGIRIYTNKTETGRLNGHHCQIRRIRSPATQSSTKQNQTRRTEEACSQEVTRQVRRMSNSLHMPYHAYEICARRSLFRHATWRQYYESITMKAMEMCTAMSTIRSMVCRRNKSFRYRRASGCCWGHNNAGGQQRQAV